MRLALAQITSTDDVQKNLKTIRTLFEQSSADLTIFPENSLYFRIRSGSPLLGVDLDGPELRDLLSVGKTALITTAINDGKKHPVNATVLIEPGKAPRILYRKIHLFDVDVSGAPPVRESDSFSAGESPAVWDFQGWKFGLSICYDLRFAELYLRYSQEVDAILVPSAFLVPTGEAHWRVLLRARAIESQCYVVAPAQGGEHVSESSTRKTYGHSLAVDPWGRVLVDMEKDSPSLKMVELNRDEISKVRKQIPMKEHRRL